MNFMNKVCYVRYCTSSCLYFTFFPGVEDFTLQRVFLLDQLQDPSFTSTAQYCNHTNGPATEEYNVLVKESE